MSAAEAVLEAALQVADGGGSEPTSEALPPQASVSMPVVSSSTDPASTAAPTHESDPGVAVAHDSVRPGDGHEYKAGPESEGAEPIRTLFIGGLPGNCTEREIHNLFHPHEETGYEGSQLQIKYSSAGSSFAIAFAVFISPEHAAKAMTRISGGLFDRSSNSYLKVEMARTNTRVKRLRDSDQTSEPKRSRVETGAPYGRTTSQPAPYASGAPSGYAGGHSAHAPPPYSGSSGYGSHTPSAQGSFGAPAAAPQYGSRGHFGGYAGGGGGGGGGYRGSGGMGPPRARPPCNTLFVGSLPPTATESTLNAFFSQYPGFNRLKFQSSPGRKPVAFVAYSDVAQATYAKQCLEGARLAPTDPEPMMVEFAKSAMKPPAPPGGPQPGGGHHAQAAPPVAHHGGYHGGYGY